MKSPKLTTEQKLRIERDKKAAAAGEGSWQNKTTKEWCPVRVSFYPKKKLWITEAGEERQITLEQLKTRYQQLEL